MNRVNIPQLLDYLTKVKPEEHHAVIKDHLAQVWDEGLDFAGDALRAGCSLTEAATANPYRKPEPPMPDSLKHEFQMLIERWQESSDESRSNVLSGLMRQAQAHEPTLKGHEDSVTLYRLVALMQNIPGEGSRSSTTGVRDKVT